MNGWVEFSRSVELGSVGDPTLWLGGARGVAQGLELEGRERIMRRDVGLG